MACNADRSVGLDQGKKLQIQQRRKEYNYNKNVSRNEEIRSYLVDNMAILVGQVGM